MTHHVTRRDVDSLVAEMERVRSDLADWADTVKDMGRKGLKATASNLLSQAKGLREGLYDTWDGTRERSKKAVDVVQHQIEERPLVSALSLLGVIAVGVLLAQLLTRR